MAGFGEALRRERELREIGLREIANATKINLRYLEALEQGRFDILPGGVFNKGFIRAYARFIGADGEALVDRYMQEIAERDAAAQGAQPAPDRPGLLRPPEAPRRRAGGGSAGGADAAGSPVAVSAVAPAISLVENSRPAVAAWPAPAPVPAPAEAEANRSRLLLALATVVAALVAVAVVIALLRAARRDAALPAPDNPAGNPAAPPAQDSGSATAPETAATPGPASNAPAPVVEEPPAASIPAGPPATTAVPRKPERRDNPPQRPKTDDGTEGARIASPLAPPQAPRPAEPPPSPSPAVTSGPMTVRIVAQAPVAVQVSCDGEDRINRTFQANESEVLRCFSVVRVSATDAGALALSIDGAPCAALGPAGGRVEHFTIRPDTARAICPAAASGDGHGRR
jgi:cytoskeletal protein RodZ